MKTFNEIYILNLHGNAKKKEKSPDGSKDENVFDIQQGVAIALFVKRKNETGCKVHYSEIWGQREQNIIGFQTTRSSQQIGKKFILQAHFISLR